MDHVELPSWKDFVARVNGVHRANIAGPELTRWRFRGHASASWQLEPTLIRAGYSDMFLTDYYEKACMAARLLGNFEKTSSSLHEVPDLSWEGIRRGLPNYEFLAYLRHHGFPSPLLDWTNSPFIAAYFAFSDALRAGSDKVAIYAYREMEAVGEFRHVGEGEVIFQGAYASVHLRHVQQQSVYSICCRLTGGRPLVLIDSHERVFGLAKHYGRDRHHLIKYTLPVGMRDLVLGNLMQMNINEYSIYQSHDALVRTISNEVFERFF